MYPICFKNTKHKERTQENLSLTTCDWDPEDEPSNRRFPGEDRRFFEDRSAERPWGRYGTPRALVTHAMRFPWTKKAKTIFFCTFWWFGALIRR